MQASDLAGINLDYRPKSYFWPLGLETHLLSRVKGAERKAALKALIDAGRLEEIPEQLAKSGLTEAERRSLGRIHPAFMGGEYLPDLMPNEVMIARITIASTTQDVTCVYARRGKDRIHYRVVDEYGGDTLSGTTSRTSTLPLTLGDLEEFFSGAWSLLEVLGMNFSEDGYDEDEMQSFVVGIDSEFYPQLEHLYRSKISEMAADHGIDDEEKDVEADDEIVISAFERDFPADAAALEKLIKEFTSSWPAPTSYGSEFFQASKRSRLRRQAIEFQSEKKRLPDREELAALTA